MHGDLLHVGSKMQMLCILGRFNCWFVLHGGYMEQPQEEPMVGPRRRVEDVRELGMD